VSVASHGVMYMHNYKASSVQASNALICWMCFASVNVEPFCRCHTEGLSWRGTGALCHWQQDPPHSES